MSAYRGRIAPSPTGYLHLGHARTFLIAQQRASKVGGTLVLRNDDLDAQRCRPEYAQAMLEDMQWLGLHWNEGPVSLHLDGEEAGTHAPYRQSLRLDHYRAAFDSLQAAGHVYACRCSRKDLQAMQRAPHAADEDEPIYPGTCRQVILNELDTCAWRFRVHDGEIVEFLDRNLGPQRFICGEHFGDFLVLRRDGLPSYQLACAVDDAAMGITEVVRGRDLLLSTARQLLLMKALGLPAPAYYHCALLVDKAGERLAKRHDALSIRTLRRNGYSAHQVQQMAFTADAR